MSQDASHHTPRSLEESVELTIRYFGMHQYAPTLLELERWLLHTRAFTASTPLATLQKAITSIPSITQCNGFYTLQGQEHLAQQRTESYTLFDAKWKHAKPFLTLLSALPFVEAIWFSNSMGWMNPRHDSDIDLVIVTTPGHIWGARFFTTGLMKLLRQRPEEQRKEKALCLSFYTTSDNLNMQPYAIGIEDVHFNFWVAQMYPVYDPHGLYKRYQQENDWVRQQFANLQWAQPITRNTIQPSRVRTVIQKLLQLCAPEQFLKRLQLRLLPSHITDMANTDNRVVMNDDILKLHTNDRRKEQQCEWETLVAETTRER